MKLRIISRRDGFRRCGRAWSAAGAVVDSADFSPEELERLRADPVLIVQDADAEPPPSGAAVPAAVHAEALERCRIAEARVAELEARAAGTDGPGAGADARVQRAAAAIDELAPGDPSHWTQAGKPEVAALRRVSGVHDLTAAERDAAWAARPAD